MSKKLLDINMDDEGRVTSVRPTRISTTLEAVETPAERTAAVRNFMRLAKMIRRGQTIGPGIGTRAEARAGVRAIKVATTFIVTRLRRLPPSLVPPRLTAGLRLRRLARGAGIAGAVITALDVAYGAVDSILTKAAAGGRLPPTRPPTPADAFGDFYDDAGENLRRLLQDQAENMARAVSNPPVPGIVVHAEQFGKSLKLFGNGLRGTMAQLLRKQMAQVLRRAIEYTPPFSGARQSRMQQAAKGTYTGTARRAGERSVSFDIRRVFVPVDELRAYRRNERFMEAVRNNDQIVIRSMLGPKFHFAVIGPHLDTQLHQRQRNSRGRVAGSVGRKPLQQLVTGPNGLGAINEYVKQRQTKVGYAKSGWRKAVDVFGLGDKGGGKARTLPGWVARHHGAGSARDVAEGESPILSALISNEVRFIQYKEKAIGIARLAVAAQEKAFQSNLRRILKEAGKR